MKKYSNEFKVGVIVILAVLGLGYMTFKAGNFRLKRSGYHIYAAFDNIAGLEKNAPVRLRGVTVGYVDNIQISNAKVILSLWVDDTFKIKGTPNIYIRTLGLMGEKYIQIIDQKDAAAYLTQNSQLTGKTPGDLEELLTDNQGSITAMISNFESVSRNLDELSLDLKNHPWKLLFRTKEKK